jgi:hypothetical protein
MKSNIPSRLSVSLFLQHQPLDLLIHDIPGAHHTYLDITAS